MKLKKHFNFGQVTALPSMSEPRLHMLRGWLAVGLLWHHMAPPPLIFNMPFSIPGRVIVWLFYGLSGYLIGQSFLSGRYQLSRSSIINFMFRRLLRIIPLLYFVCFIVWLLGGQPRILDGAAFLKILFLSYDFNHFPWVDSAWFLGPLVQLYLISPLIFPVLKKMLDRYDPAAIMIGLIVLTPVLQYVSFGINQMLKPSTSMVAGFDDRTMLGNLSAFVMGAMTGPLRQKVTSFKDPSRLKTIFYGSIGLLWLVSVQYFVLAKYFWILPTIALVNLSAVGLILYCLADETTNQRDGKGGKFLFAMGTLSYGIFLWHGLMIECFAGIFADYNLNYLRFVPAFLAVGGMTILLAYVTYRGIEQPFQKGVRLTS